MYDETHEFARLARQYCSWAEQPSPQSPADEVVTALELLLHLHLAALRLPDGEPSEDDIESTSHEEWRGLTRRFGSLPVDLYWEVFDPLQSAPEEPVCASLGDDLAEIHRDLRRGLGRYDRGEVAAAAWEWAFHFRVHWGHHLSAATYALQSWWAANCFGSPADDS